MPSRMLKRILAFNFDFNIVLIFSVIGLFFVSSYTFRALAFSLVTYKFGNPFFISWIVIGNLVFLGPLPMFLSLLFFSGSPGQLMNGLREIDDTKNRRIDVLQAFMLSYFLIPSIFLGTLPQIAALFMYEKRTLVQMLASSRTWMKGESPDERDNSQIPIWIGGLCTLAGLILMGIFVSTLFNSNFSRKGIMVGGSSEQRASALQDLKTGRAKNSTPEIAFQGLRTALATKNAKALVEQFTSRAQMYVTSKARNLEIFRGLPDDLEYVRTETINAGKVRILVHPIVMGAPVKEEEEIFFLKEFNEWKFDLFTFLQGPYATQHR